LPIGSLSITHWCYTSKDTGFHLREFVHVTSSLAMRGFFQWRRFPGYLETRDWLWYMDWLLIIQWPTRAASFSLLNAGLTFIAYHNLLEFILRNTVISLCTAVLIKKPRTAYIHPDLLLGLFQLHKTQRESSNFCITDESSSNKSILIDENCPEEITDTGIWFDERFLK